TAVTGHVARLLARDREAVVVSMGRGGPPDPEIAETPPTIEALVALARAGRPAPSDYLETAALARLPTIRSRPARGGPAGATVPASRPPPRARRGPSTSTPRSLRCPGAWRIGPRCARICRRSRPMCTWWS